MGALGGAGNLSVARQLYTDPIEKRGLRARPALSRARLIRAVSKYPNWNEDTWLEVDRSRQIGYYHQASWTGFSCHR
jgi:hypothetical protein